MRRGVLMGALVAIVVTSLVPAAAAAGKGDEKKRKGKASAARLRPFPSCDSVVDYGDAKARRIYGPDYQPKSMPSYYPSSPEGAAVPVSGPAGGKKKSGGETDFSTTNVQEVDVDEPDIVKTDGNTIFAIGGNSLHAISARPTEPQLLDSLPLKGWNHELLLVGNRLLLIFQMREIPESIEPPEVPDPAPPPSRWSGSSEPAHPDARTITVLKEVDVSNPGALEVVKTEEVDGRYVSARLTGDEARVVVSTPPAARIAPQSSLRSRLGGWVPYSKFTDHRTSASARGPLLDDCSEVAHPTKFSGLDMLSVLT